jgi:hypothetical protein
MKGDDGRQEKPPEKKQEKPRKKADPQGARLFIPALSFEFQSWLIKS